MRPDLAKAGLQPAEEKHMEFPAWGLHVPERAAAGMKESHICERRAEWLTLQGLIWLPLAVGPSSLPSPIYRHVSPLVESPKASGYLDGHCLCCFQQFPEPCQEKEMRGARLSPSVSLSIRAA